MTVLGGLFLIAHGLVHVAIWMPNPKDDAPFDPHRSFLLGDVSELSRVLAAVACIVLLVAGILVLVGAGLGAGLAVAGAAISLALVVLTFHPWLIGAVAIDVGIAMVALS